MMKVPVTLVRMRREEGARRGFRLVHEVPRGVRKREDMIPLHLASAVYEESRLTDAEAQALVVREMPLEIILIAHLN